MKKFILKDKTNVSLLALHAQRIKFITISNKYVYLRVLFVNQIKFTTRPQRCASKLNLYVNLMKHTLNNLKAVYLVSAVKMIKFLINHFKRALKEAVCAKNINILIMCPTHASDLNSLRHHT
jgi:hypothetical protein